jgi:hypothetical protein
VCEPTLALEPRRFDAGHYSRTYILLSRGRTSADTYRMRRITLLGWAMVAALLAAPAMMIDLVVSRYLPVLPSALLFLGGASVGWLVAAGIFRFRGVAQGILWILVVGLPLVAIRESLRVTLGFAFGSALAWFPHCWRPVGVSTTRSEAAPAD